MSIKKISKIQPETFEFSKENFQLIEKEIKKINFMDTSFRDGFQSCYGARV